MDVVVKPVESKDDLLRAHDLLARVHSEDYSHGIHWLDTCGRRYPGYLTEHTRIALRKGELIGGLRMLTDTVRIGEARLKMGGLGWVTTDPRHRGRGVCRALMDDILAYMKRHKYHVSMLFGIPGLYHRWDYVTTLADYTVFLDTLQALTFDCPFTVRPAKPGDIPAIHRIHGAAESEIACSIIRTRPHLICKWEHWQGVRVLTDEQGKVVAYFAAVVQGDHLAVDEVGITDIGLCAAVVRACAVLAEEASLGVIQFHAPPPHPLARYLLQFQSRHEMRISHNEGGMMAFICLEETLEHMLPEWESRLGIAAAADLRTEVTLFVAGSPYRIRCNRGAVDVAVFAGKNKVSLRTDELMHLVTGYRGVDDILDSKRCLLSADARLMLRTIFPKRHPFVWRFDRF